MTAKDRISIHCTHEEDWGHIKTLVDDLKQDMDGNGKPGLRDSVTKLSVYVNELKDSVDNLKISINGLLKFQIEEETIKKNWQRNIIITLTLVGLLITGVNVAFGIATRAKKQDAEYYNKAPVQLRAGACIDTVSAEYYLEDAK